MLSDVTDHVTLSTARGGELAGWLRTATGSTYECPACGQSVTIGSDTDVRGYRHREGFADGNGIRWWTYVSCPGCDYELTYDQYSSYVIEN